MKVVAAGLEIEGVAVVVDRSMEESNAPTAMTARIIPAKRKCGY